MKRFCPPDSSEPRIYVPIDEDFVNESVLEDGSITTKLVCKKIPNPNEGLTPDDFKLSVLLSNNASSILKETKPFDPKPLELASQIESYE